MQATLYPGKQLIKTGIPAIDIQVGALLFDTKEDAEQGAERLGLIGQGITYTIEPVDVMLSPANEQAKG